MLLLGVALQQPQQIRRVKHHLSSPWKYALTILIRRMIRQRIRCYWRWWLHYLLVPVDVSSTKVGRTLHQYAWTLSMHEHATISVQYEQHWQDTRCYSTCGALSVWVGREDCRVWHKLIARKHYWHMWQIWIKDLRFNKQSVLLYSNRLETTRV